MKEEDVRMLPDERLLMADAIHAATMRERERCVETMKETLKDLQSRSVSCRATEARATDDYDEMRLRAKAVTYGHAAEMLAADIKRMGGGF